MPRRMCLVLLAALGLVGVWVAPAGAHVELESATPAAGTVLTEPPGSLSLTFSTTPVSAGVDVTGPDGRAVAVGELGRRGPTVVVPLPALDQPGTYTVSWRAANDAHPFSGSYALTLDLPTTTTSAVSATDSIPAGSSGATSDGGGSGTGVAVAVAATLVLAALAAVLVAARRRRQRPSLPAPATGAGAGASLD